MSLVRKSTILAASLAAVFAQGQDRVGTLSIVRQVKVTRTEVTKGRDYVDARDGQPIWNNYGIRTLRRSQAEIKFTDHSVVRVNERTDMIVEDAASLRHIQLDQGAVWIRVAKGVNTTISTPTATATARGTEFEVRGDGETLVYEGTVEVKGKVTGTELLVSAGHKVTFDADGNPSKPIPLTPEETPKGRGGGVQTWFNNIEDDEGILVGMQGHDYNTLRTDPLGDPIQKPTSTNLNVIVRSPAIRPAIDPTDPRRDLGLIDDTNTSYLFPAAALATTLALDYNDLSAIQMPAVSATAFGFLGQPAFAGIRGEATGLLGQSRYGYEANAVQYYNDPSTNVLGRFGSVLYMERPIAPGFEIFAGRMKFYEGPVFEDAIDTQLIADRYTAAGVKFKEGPVTIKAAYLYDANRYVNGVQPGELLTVDYKVLGGVLGGHLLETNGPTGTGHGRSVSLTLPLLRNLVDGYAEFGTGVDGTTNTTAGVYLPFIMQATGVNVFLEYADKRSVAQSYSITGVYQIKKGPMIRGSLEWINGTSLASLGLAFKF